MWGHMERDKRRAHREQLTTREEMGELGVESTGHQDKETGTQTAPEAPGNVRG